MVKHVLYDYQNKTLITACSRKYYGSTMVKYMCLHRTPRYILKEHDVSNKTCFEVNRDCLVSLSTIFPFEGFKSTLETIC